MVTSLETLWNLAIVAAVDVEMSKNSLQLIWEKLMTDHWVWVGYGGQAIFFSRWIVQWIVSEKAGRSEIPLAIWWLSNTGGFDQNMFRLKALNNLKQCIKQIGLNRTANTAPLQL